MNRQQWTLALALLLAVTALRVVVAALLPITPDEAYYWTWSRALQPGYLDHPFMVAVWIRLGTFLLGDSALGIRLTGPFAAGVGTLFVMMTMRDLLALRDRSSSPSCACASPFIAGVLLNATLAVGLGAIVMTPDTPLLFFQSIFLWAVVRLLVSGDNRWWLVLGLVAGAGFDSKYTMILSVLALGVWVCWDARARVMLRTVWPWAGLILAVIGASPVIGWNAAHGWASFIKQGGRTGDWNPARAAQFLGELVSGQIGLLTPGIFLLAGLALWHAVRARDRVDRLLLCLIGVPSLVFLQHAAGDRVQPNWPVLLYPAIVLLVIWQGARGWKAASALGFLLGGLVLTQALTGALPLGRHLDVTLRQAGGWSQLMDEVAARSQGAAFVASDDYGLASELALRLPDRVVGGVDPRWAFAGRPELTCRTGWGVLVRNARRSFPVDHPWQKESQLLGEVVRARKGREAERYALFRVRCPLSAQAESILYRLPASQGQGHHSR
ncbi:glycosyltransferase family 39 protein [Acetobacter estunensis]|uniref:glycosyltransferase family 39 protein n=1 Tax=Acetobacter estunensis TaxID=104097 RepID=UPI001C2D35F1|nr:glycosyltransferase family 39 protein [Acetobacter estunensis]